MSSLFGAKASLRMAFRGAGNREKQVPRLEIMSLCLVLCSLSCCIGAEPMAEGGELSRLPASVDGAHRLCDHNRHPPPPSTSQARGSSARAQYPLQSHVCTPLELNAERIAKKVEGYWLKVIRTKGGGNGLIATQAKLFVFLI
ncbi:unnamed protein product [Boreogadus saida]